MSRRPRGRSVERGVRGGPGGPRGSPSPFLPPLLTRSDNQSDRDHVRHRAERGAAAQDPVVRCTCSSPLSLNLGGSGRVSVVREHGALGGEGLSARSEHQKGGLQAVDGRAPGNRASTS